ncbi:hypothetical protein BU16DRAFT_535153 [Lophium mytilinum]|uniref:Uncharacterized protein n=1 Tax=Lophium mytilinum TaxID=390894 RepID=A0A6A6R872_9PEZI|nr:hypothetical protein BU16DRAFT_535153 [Lophium mytilinum]
MSYAVSQDLGITSDNLKSRLAPNTQSLKSSNGRVVTRRKSSYHYRWPLLNTDSATLVHSIDLARHYHRAGVQQNSRSTGSHDREHHGPSSAVVLQHSRWQQRARRGGELARDQAFADLILSISADSKDVYCTSPVALPSKAAMVKPRILSWGCLDLGCITKKNKVRCDITSSCFAEVQIMA